MRKLQVCCIILIMAVSNTLFAQIGSKIFYNKKWEQIPAGDTAAYYRIYTPRADQIDIRDYYINEVLQMSGQITLNDSLKTGLYKYYDKNGRLSSEMPYVKGKRQGKYRDYYPNGKLFYEVSYNENFQTGYRMGYDTLGALKFKEQYLDDPEQVRNIIAADTNWQRHPERDCHGLQNGKSYYYHPNGRLASEELYENGKFLSANFFDPSGKVVYYNHEANSTAARPVFKGDYATYLSRAVQYPKEARKKKIEGRVIISFVVDQEGSVIQLSVVKSVHPLLDAEAIRVLESTSGLWEPAREHNLPVKVYFTSPINFRLN